MYTHLQNSACVFIINVLNTYNNFIYSSYIFPHVNEFFRYRFGHKDKRYLLAFWKLNIIFHLWTDQKNNYHYVMNSWPIFTRKIYGPSCTFEVTKILRTTSWLIWAFPLLQLFSFFLLSSAVRSQWTHWKRREIAGNLKQELHVGSRQSAVGAP